MVRVFLIAAVTCLAHLGAAAADSFTAARLLADSVNASKTLPDQPVAGKDWQQLLRATMDVDGFGSTLPSTPPAAKPAGTIARTGRLEPGDTTFDNGAYFDVWTFTFAAGELVTIALSSASFDSYLIVFRSGSTDADDAFTDDDSGPGLDSYLSFVVPQTGTWVVGTSVSPSALTGSGRTGSYTLTVATGESPSSGDFLSAGQAVRFGGWKLYASLRSDVVTLWNEAGNRGLGLSRTSNGWVSAVVGSDTLSLWSVGSYDTPWSSFLDIAGARSAVAPMELGDGTYTYGTWQITVTGDQMEIRNPTGTAGGASVTRIDRTSARIEHVGTSETSIFPDAGAIAAPTAVFTASLVSGTAPLTVRFTNTTGGTANTYAWDFGDGGTSTAISPSHTYTDAGTYTVWLTATNAGGSNSATLTVTVRAALPAPQASFTITPSSGAAPLPVRFTNTTTGTVDRYSWDFGDGGTSSSTSPSHTYTAAGTYTVVLAATNSGGSNAATRTITVRAAATRLYSRAIVGTTRAAPPLRATVGRSLRFEVWSFTRSDTTDRQQVSDYTWQVPSRLGRTTGLGQLVLSTVAGVTDSIVFQARGARAAFRITTIADSVTRLEVTPAELVIAPRQNRTYRARALDQYGNAVSGAVFSWYVVGGIGTINSRTGAFVAGSSPGHGFVIAATIVGGSIVFGDNGATVSGAGRVTVVSVVPAAFRLHQNAPNPFNAQTEITFDVPADSPVRLVVYNLNGREVAQLVDEPLPAGTHRVHWNAVGQASGTYVYRLEVGTLAEGRKMLLLR
jgi:PKD repeat protein